jgi:mono/diheme cytochrome c family protein
VDDAHITKVIKEGGAAVGLSPTMAPWGGALNDAEIAEVVKYVRSFKK